MQFLITPGFLETVTKHTPNPRQFVPANFAIHELLRGAKSEKKEPSMVVGRPEAAIPSFEDGGATVIIPSPFKFYACRDDHAEACDCGCGGGAIFTLLLPSEY